MGNRLLGSIGKIGRQLFLREEMPIDKRLAIFQAYKPAIDREIVKVLNTKITDPETGIHQTSVDSILYRIFNMGDRVVTYELDSLQIIVVMRELDRLVTITTLSVSGKYKPDSKDTPRARYGEIKMSFGIYLYAKQGLIEDISPEPVFMTKDRQVESGQMSKAAKVLSKMVYDAHVDFIKSIRITQPVSE